jgi:hypothetical protein
VVACACAADLRHRRGEQVQPPTHLNKPPARRADRRTVVLPEVWTGPTATAPAICHNTQVGGQSFAMPTPSTWEILIGRAFKLAYDLGPQLQIVDLSKTPTGANLARGWAAAMGETATGRFVRAPSANVVEARREASAFCRALADGYSAVGVGATADALALAAHGANLQMIVPTSVAYDMDGSALRKSASEAAKKLAGFAIRVTP